jgi:hypothetical protein
MLNEGKHIEEHENACSTVLRYFSSSSEVGQAAVALQQTSLRMALWVSSCMLCKVKAEVFYCDTIQFCFGYKDKEEHDVT